MKQEKYLMMFSNCITIEGASQSTIYDLQREKHYDVPKDFSEFINDFSRFSLNSIYARYGVGNKKTLDSYVGFLLENELAFFLDSFEEQLLFPKLNLDYYHPSVITNSEVEINLISDKELSRIINTLEFLGCEQIQFNILSINYKEIISKIVSSFNQSIIYSIIFNIKIEIVPDMSFLDKIIANNLRIDFISINVNQLFEHRYDKIVLYNKNQRNNNFQIAFFVNIRFFNEAQNYNPYFNRKIFISEVGQIKNVSETKEVFGNIHNMSKESIQSLVNSKEYQKFGNISKNQILQCCNCSYRYMCLDNRIPEDVGHKYKYDSVCDLQS